MKSTGESATPPGSTAGRVIQPVVFAALFWSIAAINVFWVGSVTIYSPEMEARRAVLHRAVYEGRLPPGVESWSALGANSAAVRPLIPWIAETLVSLTGLSLEQSYQCIELVSILVAFAVLFRLLGRFGSTERALLGCLYIAALLPLSYFMHYFHPWDKPSLALWLVAIVLLLEDRIVGGSLAVACAILVKFDAVVLPMLYAFVFLGRMPWRRFIARLGTVSVSAVAVYLTLSILRSDAQEARDIPRQLATNFADFRQHWYEYPPALGLLLPLLLGAAGMRTAGRDERAMYAFALVIIAILVLTTNFIEVRAEYTAVVLMLPAALRGLDHIAGVSAVRQPVA